MNNLDYRLWDLKSIDTETQNLNTVEIYYNKLGSNEIHTITVTVPWYKFMTLDKKVNDEIRDLKERLERENNKLIKQTKDKVKRSIWTNTPIHKKKIKERTDDIVELMINPFYSYHSLNIFNPAHEIDSDKIDEIHRYVELNEVENSHVNTNTTVENSMSDYNTYTAPTSKGSYDDYSSSDSTPSYSSSDYSGSDSGSSSSSSSSSSDSSNYSSFD